MKLAWDVQERLMIIVDLFAAGGAYYGGEALKAGVKAITDEINSGGSK